MAPYGLGLCLALARLRANPEPYSDVGVRDYSVGQDSAPAKALNPLMQPEPVLPEARAIDFEHPSNSEGLPGRRLARCSRPGRGGEGGKHPPGLRFDSIKGQGRSAFAAVTSCCFGPTVVSSHLAGQSCLTVRGSTLIAQSASYGEHRHAHLFHPDHRHHDYDLFQGWDSGVPGLFKALSSLI